jgi:hypothetical protein
VPLAIKLCLAAASRAECATTASAFGTGTLLALSQDTTRGTNQLKQTVVVALDYQQSRPDSSPGRSAIAAAAVVPADSQRPSGPTRPSPKNGWVFLGSYGDSTWQTRYLDFGEHASPASLRGKSLRVRRETGSLNIRANLFYEPGYDAFSMSWLLEAR